MKGPQGAFLLWRWGDREIENPAILRKQLLAIASKGFAGILVSLRNSRYEFIDRNVLRAVAQASQWAKKRNIAFWFDSDPRGASRFFISRTGERMQNLIVARKPMEGLSWEKPNIAKVIRNQFRLRYGLPKRKSNPVLQEVSLQFEPSGLERVFLFRKKGKTAVRSSVRDITSTSHFFTNIAKGYTEAFGNVRVPSDEEWWVIAFPRFDTNLYDYAGRESNDLLSIFVEELFDACTHLDGITWGEGGNGYIVHLGRFPVSFSLYNSFRAEYGYDLRDVLYALVMEMDDASHIHIRCDYYTFLMNIVFGAEKEFYRMIHSFFGEVTVGTHRTWNWATHQTNNLVQGDMDPWRSLETSGLLFASLEIEGSAKQNLDSILSALVISKSLGAFSRSERSFFDLRNPITKKELAYLSDLMALYSVSWLAHSSQESRIQSRPTSRNTHFLDLPFETFLEETNRKIVQIREITEYQFPEANVALIFPTETIMAVGPEEGEAIAVAMNRLIARWTRNGMQCDVLSSPILKEGHLSAKGFRIKNRIYEAVLFPYPHVLNEKVLETVSLMNNFNFPVLLGGNKPEYTTRGKRIPHVLPVTFDPVSDDFSCLWEAGVRPLFTAPKGALATLIRIGRDNLFLLCPQKPGGIVQGELRYKNSSFRVPKSTGLVIFRQDKNKQVKQII